MRWVDPLLLRAEAHGCDVLRHCTGEGSRPDCVSAALLSFSVWLFFLFVFSCGKLLANLRVVLSSKGCLCVTVVLGQWEKCRAQPVSRTRNLMVGITSAHDFFLSVVLSFLRVLNHGTCLRQGATRECECFLGG